MSSPGEYYSVLRRAMSALDPNIEEARRAIYERAREAIAQTDLPAPDIANERSALEAAIARIETELTNARAGRDALPRAGDAAGRQDEARPRRPALSPEMNAVLASAVILLVALAGWALWPQDPGGSRTDVGQQVYVPAAVVADRKAADETREPGRSYVFNRQMVYYRTIHPVGTLVIAKSQRFLHLVRPNTAALRYTIGVGRECTNAVGLLTVSAKEEWPETPARTVAANQPPAAPAASDGSRSRFGLRALALGDTGHRIHGTYAPTTAGDDGCFVLVNDDIVDLYERVPVGTRVVIN